MQESGTLSRKLVWKQQHKIYLNHVSHFEMTFIHHGHGQPGDQKIWCQIDGSTNDCIVMNAFFSILEHRAMTICNCEQKRHHTILNEQSFQKWINSQLNHSLVVFILLLLFMLLVDLCQGLPRMWLRGRMCDPYVKESFLTAIPQSSRRDIQPCIVSSVDFSLIIIFIDW